MFSARALHALVRCCWCAWHAPTFLFFWQKSDFCRLTLKLLSPHHLSSTSSSLLKNSIKNPRQNPNGVALRKFLKRYYNITITVLLYVSNLVRDKHVNNVLGISRKCTWPTTMLLVSQYIYKKRSVAPYVIFHAYSPLFWRRSEKYNMVLENSRKKKIITYILPLNKFSNKENMKLLQRCNIHQINIAFIIVSNQYL